MDALNGCFMEKRAAETRKKTGLTTSRAPNHGAAYFSSSVLRGRPRFFFTTGNSSVSLFGDFIAVTVFVWRLRFFVEAESFSKMSEVMDEGSSTYSDALSDTLVISSEMLVMKSWSSVKCSIWLLSSPSFYTCNGLRRREFTYDVAARECIMRVEWRWRFIPNTVLRLRRRTCRA